MTYFPYKQIHPSDSSWRVKEKIKSVECICLEKNAIQASVRIDFCDCEMKRLWQQPQLRTGKSKRISIRDS